jgi:hypothetical protein
MLPLNECEELREGIYKVLADSSFDFGANGPGARLR